MAQWAEEAGTAPGRELRRLSLLAPSVPSCVEQQEAPPVSREPRLSRCTCELRCAADPPHCLDCVSLLSGN